ncbi:MAG TPA: hypothetical protein VGG36_02275 [Rhizomicrobium sp.]|jgi:hypothetical protein
MYIFDRDELNIGVRVGLESWNAGDRIPDDYFVRLTSHPRFRDAAHALAANMLAASQSDKALDGIFKDAGRFVAAMFAIYLHVTGGLTLPRLKEICASSGYLSPGRARALLNYMRYLGYVEPVTKRVRGEPLRYVPTASFKDAWRNYLRAGLEAARVIEPAVGLVLDRLEETSVQDCISRVQGEGMLASTRSSSKESGFVRVFIERHAGAQILRVLVLEDADEFPPRKALPFSIAALARRFAVSRIHVRRMLDEAVREKLLMLDPEGGVTLTDRMRWMLATLYATQLIRLLGASAQTLAELPERPRAQAASAALAANV